MQPDDLSGWPDNATKELPLVVDDPAPDEPVATGEEPAEPGTGQQGGGAAARRRSFLVELPILVVIALVIALVIKTFVVQAFWIPTGSMQNTLGIYDKILV